MSIHVVPAPEVATRWLRHPLAEYRRGDFLMSNQDGTILGRGSRRISLSAGQAANPASYLEGAHTIAGTLPFEPGAPGAFVLLDSTLRGPHLSVMGASKEVAAEHLALADAVSGAFSSAVRELTPEAPDAHYREAVRTALTRFSPGGLRKVVLARAQRATLESPLDVAQFLHRLLGQNPAATTFAAPLPHGATLVGATPELLIKRSGQHIVSHPLAGSIPLTHDAKTDAANAQALLESAKDLAEHAFVVDMITQELSPLCKQLTVPSKPALVNTGTMLHLGTRITGVLADPNINALQLAFALHPTPAVCGWPTAEAAAAIAELEPASRGFYAGAVGWMDSNGDGQWHVSIRCAEVAGNTVRLHAGAGIVPGSDPELEFAETEGKFRTMLKAMGVQSK